MGLKSPLPNGGSYSLTYFPPDDIWFVGAVTPRHTSAHAHRHANPIALKASTPTHFHPVGWTELLQLTLHILEMYEDPVAETSSHVIICVKHADWASKYPFLHLPLREKILPRTHGRTEKLAAKFCGDCKCRCSEIFNSNKYNLPRINAECECKCFPTWPHPLK